MRFDKRDKIAFEQMYGKPKPWINRQYLAAMACAILALALVVVGALIPSYICIFLGVYVTAIFYYILYRLEIGGDKATSKVLKVWAVVFVILASIGMIIAIVGGP